MKAFLLKSIVLGAVFFAAAGFIEPAIKLLMAPPTITTTVVSNIGTTTADSGGENISDGGFMITRRGLAVDLESNPPPDTTDIKILDGSGGTGDFITPITGLTAETQYGVRAWALNSNDELSFGLEENFWTLSLPPTGAVGATATSTGTTSINLTFNDLATLTDADGYVILRRQGSDPTLTTGTAPNPAWLIQTITTNGVTNYSDTGLNPNTTYRYLIAPFNYNNTDVETYNYQTTGNNVMATTDPPASASTIAAAGNEGGDLDYFNFQLGNINGIGQGVRVWSITITDPGAADDDGLPTIVDDIIFGEGPSNSAGFNSTLRAAALFEGGAEIADGSVGAGTITFTNINESIAQSSSRTFDLYVSFDNTVTDGQQLQIDINSATTTGTSSNFGVLGTVQSTHTAGVSNKVQVVATRLDIVSTPSTVVDVTDFNLTVQAEDGFDNIDIDASPSVTLSANPAAISSVTGLTQSLTSGNYTWTDVQLDAASAGSSLVTASGGGLTNATQSIDVEVPGVILTPADTVSFCAQNQVITLTDIVITEGVSSDFGVEPPGTSQEYVIRLPNGYEFVTPASSISVTETAPGSTDVSNITGKFILGRFFRFEYDVTGTSNKDEITISNIQVEKTSSATGTNLIIERIAGNQPANEVTAIQNGNGPTEQDHGVITFGGVDNATFQQLGGSSTFCIGAPVLFEATGGNQYTFYKTPDGGSTMVLNVQDSGQYVTAELADLDVVSVRVENTLSGCFQDLSLPAMMAEVEPVVRITQPAESDTLIQFSDAIELIAEDSVGGAVTPNGGTFIGPFVQDLGSNNFSFSPDSAGVFELIYNFTSGAGCTASDTVEIVVINLGGKLIDDLADQYCIDDGPVTFNWNQPRPNTL